MFYYSGGKNQKQKGQDGLYLSISCGYFMELLEFAAFALIVFILNFDLALTMNIKMFSVKN